LRTAFKDRKKGVPQGLASDKQLLVGAIQSRIDQLREEKMPAIKVDAFTSFRAHNEQSETINKRQAAVAAAAPSSKRPKTATVAAAPSSVTTDKSA